MSSTATISPGIKRSPRLAANRGSAGSPLQLRAMRKPLIAKKIETPSSPNDSWEIVASGSGRLVSAKQ